MGRVPGRNSPVSTGLGAVRGVTVRLPELGLGANPFREARLGTGTVC